MADANDGFSLLSCSSSAVHLLQKRLKVGHASTTLALDLLHLLTILVEDCGWDLADAEVLLNLWLFLDID